MDNQLTPNRIHRLIHFAADKSVDKSFQTSAVRKLHLDEDLKRRPIQQAAAVDSNTKCEASSGLLDLEHVVGFGESGVDNMFLNKSTRFNPGEMTGRSTEESNTPPVGHTLYGRYSIDTDIIANQADKQTSEIIDIMRHSIATSSNSFHSKPHLTQDEVNFIRDEAPVPVLPQNIHEICSESIGNTNMSIGVYFQNKCTEFHNLFNNADSPDRYNQISSEVQGQSLMPSISEVSIQSPRSDMHEVYKIDQSLDCVPVKQSRDSNVVGSEKQINPNIVKYHTYTIPSEKTGIENQVAPNMLNMGQTKAAAVPTDVFIETMQKSLALATTQTDDGTDTSLSISKIAEILAKQSITNVSVTDLLRNQIKQTSKKQPLTELHLNAMENRRLEQKVQVTTLKDSSKSEEASSSETTNTVISRDRFKVNQENRDVPDIVITQHPLRNSELRNMDFNKIGNQQKLTKSKSPSSKSQSTLRTVQEKFASFQSGGDSPVHSCKGEVNTSRIPSPNVEYKELDKSVDWQELLQKHSKNKSLAKEQWAEVTTTPVDGFVGVTCAVAITITTLTDSWLTVRFQFDDFSKYEKEFTIEHSRLPMLLLPRKSQEIHMQLTSNVEMNTSLPFTISLKDASINEDIEIKGQLKLNIKMPSVDALSADGANIVKFPPIHEKSSLSRCFVLLSDCPVDLQLDLSVVEGESMFKIKNVQEIKRDDVSKVLVDRQGLAEDSQTGKCKNKVWNKQLCRLTSGNAIKVIISFNAPELSDLQLAEAATFQGRINVNLMGVDTVIKKIGLIAGVASSNLVVRTPTNRVKLTKSNDKISLQLSNTGALSSTWIVKVKKTCSNDNDVPFDVTPSKLEIHPGCSKTVVLTYTDPEERPCEAVLLFEDSFTGKRTVIDILGGLQVPKKFPIKTNHTNVSWVHAGRKEISLKNSTNEKIQIKCQIFGEGFSLDIGVEMRGKYISFEPCECKPLSIIFAPKSNMPHSATLHLILDKNSDYSRTVKLFACEGDVSVHWAGLVTFGDIALVRAVSGMPVELTLANKSNVPIFVAAHVRFNLQYASAAAASALAGARRVVRARRHALALRVAWARVERRRAASPYRARARPPPAALATLTAVVGADLTRRRILRILKDESNGPLDTSLLPDHLKILTEPFEDEDPAMDELLKDFKETKAALPELIGGLQELIAQIDLPQDITEENNTIVITDDTVTEHHTLVDE